MPSNEIICKSQLMQRESIVFAARMLKLAKFS